MFFQQFIIFDQKRLIFSFIKISSICTCFFTIFVTSKIFQTTFTKINLIRYYYFINIYIVYLNRLFVLVKFMFFYFSTTTLYNFLSVFIYALIFFIISMIYNAPVFFTQIDVFHQVYVIIFANSANNTTINSAVNI